MEKVTDQIVWGLLNDTDNKSGIAWKNEDPSLEWMLQWLETNPDSEDDDDKPEGDGKFEDGDAEINVVVDEKTGKLE